MPRMTGQAIVVAANATSANVLAGQQYEFLPRTTSILLAAAASAVGINCTLLIGGVTVVDDQPISQANRFPILPDDAVTQEVARAGSRLILRFRNTTAGALNVNFSLDVG